jgi:hypothetical protein
VERIRPTDLSPIFNALVVRYNNGLQHAMGCTLWVRAQALGEANVEQATILQFYFYFIFRDSPPGQDIAPYIYLSADVGFRGIVRNRSWALPLAGATAYFFREQRHMVSARR